MRGSNHSVFDDRKRRNLREKFLRMRCGRLTRRRGEARLHRCSIVEPQLDDAVDREVLVAAGLALDTLTPNHDVAPVTSHARNISDELFMDLPLTAEVVFSDIGATLHERHPLPQRSSSGIRRN